MDIEIEFICDRGVSHEAVRHRMCSPMQESTRYCNYSEKGKHDLNVIEPIFFDKNEPWSEVDRPYSSGWVKMNKFDVWRWAMLQAEWSYNQLLRMGASPQEARSVLPNSLKTKLKIKANIREWFHIFQLRAINSGAHPQIREIMIPALQECAERWPTLFEWLLEDLDTKLVKPARAKNPDETP
jgi:thymidylate synthase (FAD)